MGIPGEIKAVYEADLDNLLEETGLLNDFKDQKLKCKFCGKIVTYSNIYSVLLDSGQYKVVSSDSECVAALMAHLGDKRHGKIQG